MPVPVSAMLHNNFQSPFLSTEAILLECLIVVHFAIWAVEGIVPLTRCKAPAAAIRQGRPFSSQLQDAMLRLWTAFSGLKNSGIETVRVDDVM